MLCGAVARDPYVVTHVSRCRTKQHWYKIFIITFTRSPTTKIFYPDKKLWSPKIHTEFVIVSWCNRQTWAINPTSLILNLETLS